LTPRFRLFNKKDEPSKAKIGSNQLQTSENVLISEALALIRTVESRKIEELCGDLASIRDAVAKSLKTIEKLANDLEREKIKVEEPKFESIVEISKRTVVASLKRESSMELPSPKSYNDAMKFKQRLEAITNRFREVSASHNRVFNVFIKKYAGKLKDEFETLSSLSKKMNSILVKFDNHQEPFLKCSDLLSQLSNKISSIEQDEKSIEHTRNEIMQLQRVLKELKNQMTSIENSPEFHEAAMIGGEIKRLEHEEEEAHKELLCLFSPVSRAFTKYSYGITKQTSERLRVLSEEPWNIFSETELTPYLDILAEIQKALIGEKICLKDTMKVAGQLEGLIKALPDFKKKFESRQRYLKTLRQRNEAYFGSRSTDLKEEIKNSAQRIEEEEIKLHQLENQLEEKRLQLYDLRKESEDCLFRIFDKKYELAV
jgi:DNA repair exonuclease SbcCD ATPase subunit